MRIRSNEKKIQMGIYILLTCAATLHEQSTFTHRQSQHTTVTHATARSFTARHTHQFIDAIISAILHEHLHMSVSLQQLSITLSHTRLTKQTSLIHSLTLAYCQATRSHSMHALAVMHSRTLSHTHHDRVSRVGSGSVLREVCACAVVTTSSLLLLSCGKRPVRGCERV